jgi:hypothetical protein
MDPDLNLQQQLDLARGIIAHADKGDFDVADVTWVGDNAALLAELVLALDGWLRKQGAPPKPWFRAFNRARVAEGMAKGNPEATYTHVRPEEDKQS